MRRAIAPFILLLFLGTGCDTKEDPADQPDPILELTDGYCLVSGDVVLLNHHQIEHYDYGTHLIYLKPEASTPSIVEVVEEMSVYAGGEEIYTVTTQPGSSSYLSAEPFIWTDPIFYGENIFAIGLVQTYEEMQDENDPREDSRIVAALNKYDQYREGLRCEFLSINYESTQTVEVKLKLSNGDSVNYYYLDPERMGMDLFHYFTTGLVIWDKEQEKSYQNLLDLAIPEPWDAWDLSWLSLLEQGTTDTLTISYNRFDVVPPGTYPVFFTFPGLSYQVERKELEQAHGRIWLGLLQLHGEVVVEEDWGI